MGVGKEIINKGGRPKKEIDKRIFENLCAIQCVKDEICDIFDVDEKTLTRWCKDTYNMGFSDVYKKKSATGKMSLRRYQFDLAKKSPAMAIFLGKNYLGQKDTFEQNIEDKNGIIDDLIGALNSAKKAE